MSRPVFCTRSNRFTGSFDKSATAAHTTASETNSILVKVTGARISGVIGCNAMHCWTNKRVVHPHLLDAGFGPERQRTEARSFMKRRIPPAKFPHSLPSHNACAPANLCQLAAILSIYIDQTNQTLGQIRSCQVPKLRLSFSSDLIQARFPEASGH